MKIRAVGSEEDLNKLVGVFGQGGLHVVKVSQFYDDLDDSRNKRVYIDIMSDDRKVVFNLQDHQVIEYCNQWRSKNDVLHNFFITFDEASEILDRLAEEGALVKMLDDKKYVYVDSRYLKFVKPRCGNCCNRGMFGECYLNVKFDDVPEDKKYIPVSHKACDKYVASFFAIDEAMTKSNFRMIMEAEE